LKKRIESSLELYRKKKYLNIKLFIGVLANLRGDQLVQGRDAHVKYFCSVARVDLEDLGHVRHLNLGNLRSCNEEEAFIACFDNYSAVTLGLLDLCGALDVFALQIEAHDRYRLILYLCHLTGWLLHHHKDVLHED